MASSSQSLCLACGICCEGMLSRSVPLTPEDEISPLVVAGINIIADGKLNLFTLPCAAHKNRECTVYADRPRMCQKYRCELLKRFEAGKISRDAALEIVEKTITVRNEMKTFADSTNEPNVRLIFQQWLKNPSSGLKKSNIGTSEKAYAPLFFKFLIFQKYLDRYFRKEPLVWLSRHLS